MKQVTILSILAFIFLCNPSKAQDKSTENAIGGRATKGDTVWVIVNHIKADKRQQFEHFIMETFWPMARKLTTGEQLVFKQTRVLYPTRAEQDGTFSYIFLMDPLISGADYRISSLLKKMYGPQQAEEYGKVLHETFASDQTQYLQVQTQY